MKITTLQFKLPAEEIVEKEEAKAQAAIEADPKIAAAKAAGKLARKKAVFILNNQPSLLEKLIRKVPDYTVSLLDPVGPPPITFEHNNYGVTPDEGTTIEQVEGHIEFYVDGVKKRVVAPPAFTDGKQVFRAELTAIFADAVKVSEVREGRGFHSFAVADGCNWGVRPRRAASTAVDVASKSLHAQLEKFITEQFEVLSRSITKTKEDVLKITTRKIAEFQLAAFLQAQAELERLGDEVGTTTLTLGLVVGDYSVVIRLGDSDVSLLRIEKKKLRCVNVTEGSRADSIDATDSGGCLGRDVEYEQGRYGANWRNLAVSVVKLKPNDLIVVCTDGIRDTLDPEQLGIKPTARGHTQWNNQVPELSDYRQHLLNKKFAEVAGGNFEMIPARLISFVSATTLKTKLALLENTQAKISVNYEEHQGKEDHTAGVVILVRPMIPQTVNKTKPSVFSKK